LHQKLINIKYPNNLPWDRLITKVPIARRVAQTPSEISDISAKTPDALQ
jgi:hypothetical protein